MTDFAVTARHENGFLVVAPQGELDIATVAAVRAELSRRKPDEGLLYDLTALEFVDTSGIALAVEAYRDAQAEGFSLRIRRAPERVQRVFEIAGLEDVLPFEDGAHG